jgi:hypothetical protein
MDTQRPFPNVRAIRRRSARIRRNWTPAERRRRTGIPPDAPWCLQEFLTRVDRWPWDVSNRAASVATYRTWPGGL